MPRHRLLKTAKASLGLLLLGCATTKHVPTQAEQSFGEIRLSSRAIAVTNERIRFEAEEVLALLREHPTERWLYQEAMARLYTLAYAEAAFDAESLFARGRELGRECLRVNGAWQVMEDLSGGRITASGLRRLDTQDLPCLRALLQHWIRWVESSGTVAQIDLRPLALLSTRAMELAESKPQWTDHWSMGMILTLGSPVEEQRQAAEFHFQRAIELAPGLATPAIDRLSGHMRQGIYSEALREELRSFGRGRYPVNESAPWSLQNQRALKRAIELLAQLRENDDD